MAYNLKEIMATKPSRFTAGHRMCAGCGAPPVARMIMRALHEGDHAVVSNAPFGAIPPPRFFISEPTITSAPTSNGSLFDTNSQ